MAKNFVYAATCIDDRGWAQGPGGEDECLWGCGPEERIFATAKEARAFVRDVRNAGCWSYDDDETGETVNAPPALSVERCAVHEWLWGDHREAVTDRVVDLHGGPIRLADMPPHVARFLVALFERGRRAWQRESANLRGASSATHTAAFIAARFSGRADEVRQLMDRRGIAL